MLNRKPFNQHTPPPHPNWTGRSYRTSREAYGGQLRFPRERPRIDRYEMAIYVICLFAMAVVGLVLLGESA